MILQYGADAVRWFILSDSPPEKDVQWSDRVLPPQINFQKIDLNSTILSRKDCQVDKDLEDKFIKLINSFNQNRFSIKNFRFNVSIAHFYELYNLFTDSVGKDYNKVIKSKIVTMMKLMLLFTPHLL